MTENYFDGTWRPVVGPIDKALDVLRSRGFELGADDAGKLMARWPVAPAAPAGVGYWVSLDYATFGIWERYGIVTDAAPIARKSIGRSIADVLAYYHNQDARIEKLNDQAAPLTFEGIPLEYWREEVRLECAVSLERLRTICESRGASYELTIKGLREAI